MAKAVDRLEGKQYRSRHFVRSLPFGPVSWRPVRESAFPHSPVDFSGLENARFLRRRSVAEATSTEGDKLWNRLRQRKPGQRTPRSKNSARGRKGFSRKLQPKSAKKTLNLADRFSGEQGFVVRQTSVARQAAFIRRTVPSPAAAVLPASSLRCGSRNSSDARTGR